MKVNKDFIVYLGEVVFTGLMALILYGMVWLFIDDTYRTVPSNEYRFHKEKMELEYDGKTYTVRDADADTSWVLVKYYEGMDFSLKLIPEGTFETNIKDFESLIVQPKKIHKE